MILCLLHTVFSGHRWDLKAQSACAPNQSLANWAAQSVMSNKTDLAVKAVYGWSEALLACRCGSFRKIEMVGNQK